MSPAATRPVRQVLIVKTLIKQYRQVFFERLQEALQDDGVALKVVYGEPDLQEHRKGDNIDLPTSVGHKIPSRYFWGSRLLWQWPGWREITQSDLIIVVNANRNVLNLFLLLLSTLKLKKVAFWGHGQNHQTVKKSIKDWFKERIVLLPHWWFAYTEQTATYLQAIGFREQRITTINNAIDTTGFASEVESVSADELRDMRQRLGLGDHDRVALYCGSLYPEKRIPCLLNAAAMVARQNPDFRLVMIGSGAEEALVRKACQAQPHLRYAGPLFGREKAICYRLSEVIVNPGLVGLAILDAFAAGRPIMTLSNSLHSPEIAYLSDGENGLLVHGDEDAFAKAILRILGDEPLRSHLCDGARRTANVYTVEHMVERVKQGILQCLDTQ